MFSKFTHWHKQWAWVTCAQTKPGREAFPNIPGKPEHESNTDISLPDPRKRKRRVCTQAINYYKSKSLSSCAMKQISKWLVLQGTSNMKIVFLKNLTIFFTEADKHRMSAQLEKLHLISTVCWYFFFSFSMEYSQLALNRCLYKTDTSLRWPPRVGLCLSLLLFPSL